MIKTVAVDTNVLLDFLFKREPGYEKSLKLISECSLNKVQIFIPNIVFPEIEWVTRSFYQQPKDLIVRFFNELISLDGVLTEDKTTQQLAINIFSLSNIKFTDAIILAQLQNFQPDEFLTYDENLKKLYRQKNSQN